MKLFKKLLTLAVASAVVFAMSLPAFAATDDYEIIENVDLEIYSEIEVGQEEGSEESLEITVDSDGCEISSITVTNQPKNGWDEDDQPKVRIVLEVYEDYRFASGFSKDDVYLSGIGGEVVSVSRSTKKLTITIELPEVGESEYYDDDDYDLYIDRDSLGWDAGNRGFAYWEGNDYAKSYEVKIYRNDDEIETTKVLTTENDYYDFSAYFRGSGDYSFRVRAVRNSSNKGDWERSEEQYVTADEAAAIFNRRADDGYIRNSNSGTSGSSTQEGNGRWMQDTNGWWWLRADRSWPANQWSYINNEWYWFDASGYCAINAWRNVDGVYYYLGESGAMYANRRTPDGYWVDASGAWDGKDAV